MDKSEVSYQLRMTEVEKQRLIKEQAKLTHDWLRDNQCIRMDNGEIGNYATITEGKVKSKPVWVNWSELPVSWWTDVYGQMLALSYPIAFRFFHGWYIGTAGEQGVHIGKRINYLMTTMKSLTRNLEYVILAGDYPEVDERLHNALNPAWKDTDIGKLVKGLEDTMVNAGVSVQTSIASLLLSDGEENV